MRYFLLFTYCLFIPSFSSAQVWEWVQTAGSEKEVNYGSAVHTDAKGNIYVIGCHHPSFFLHQDVNTDRTASLVSSIRRSDRMFVAKYSKLGELLWVNQAYGRFVEPKDLLTDKAGNLYVTGHFASQTTFTSLNQHNKRLNGFEPGLMFLAKYDAYGNLKWVVKGGNPKGYSSGESLILEGDRVFVCGYVEASPGQPLSYKDADYSRHTFMPIKACDKAFVSVGQVIIFNTKGHLKEARFIGGEGGQVRMRDMKMDVRGNYFISGTYQGYFREGSNTFASEAEEGFVMAFDLRARLQWDIRIEARFGNESWPRLAYTHDKLAFAFVCEGKSRLFYASGEPLILGSEASWEQTLCASQINLKGFPIWQYISPPQAGGLGVHDLDYSSRGQLCLTGHYTDAFQLHRQRLSSPGSPIASDQPTPIADPNLPDKNTYVLRFTPKGKVEWALGSENGRYEIAYGMEIDAGDNIYTTGYFNGNKQAKFGRAPLRELGEVNVFLAKINPRKKDREIIYPEIPLPKEIKREAKVVRTRQVIAQQQIEVFSTELEVHLWDNRQIDGDIISLFLGDSCVLPTYTLRANSKALKLSISEDTLNQLILYADNVGEIGPNTAAVTVFDGHRRQRIHLQAGLDRSEALTIKYTPPEKPEESPDRPILRQTLLASSPLFSSSIPAAPLKSNTTTLKKRGFLYNLWQKLFHAKQN